MEVAAALPLTAHACRRGGGLHALGDHRAACATAGVLQSRAIPLECALARVCREAGACVAQNVRLVDMSLQIAVHDARRIEVFFVPRILGRLIRGVFWHASYQLPGQGRKGKHNIQRRALAAGAAARGRPLLCWRWTTALARPAAGRKCHHCQPWQHC